MSTDPATIAAILGATSPGPRSRFARLAAFLAEDHASRLDPYIKWVRNPLAVLSLAAVAAVPCGLFLHPRGLVLAAGLAALVAVGTAWPWVSARGLSGRLAFGRDRVREGEAVAATLVVRNRWPWGAWGIALRGSPDGRGASLAHVPGWGAAEVRWELVPDRRGIYPGASRGPSLATAFPFGLIESGRRLDVPGRLIVWPASFPVGALPDATSGTEGDGLDPRDRPGSSGDPIGVRPYRRGDSIRRVHWPQSARQGELIVSEVESRGPARVQVVVDLDPATRGGSGASGTAEWSIRIAASLAGGWIAQGAEVEVLHGGAGGRIDAGKGPPLGRLRRVLDALAGIDLEGDPGSFAPLARLLDGPEARRFAGALRVVIATDLGLIAAGDRPGSPTGRGPSERYVTLDAGAFADDRAGRAGPPRLPVRPWIRVDDPVDVAGQVRRAGKGGGR